MGMTVLQTAGLSHSDTAGSRDICSSPALFAAYRVLHRLREPRHPPCALSYFRHAGKTSKTSLPKLILSAVCVKSSARSPQQKTAGGQTGRNAARGGGRHSLACAKMSKIAADRIRPVRVFGTVRAIRTIRFTASVENNGFEPLTPCLQSRCSSQLS